MVTVSLQKTKVKVKICGITNLGDTLAAMGAGADMLGFNFSARSPRLVSVEKVSAILREAPKGFQRVGVFQDAAPEEVGDTVRRLDLHCIQLHGNEDPEAYRAPGVPIIQAFHIASADDVAKAASSTADFLLLDTPSEIGGGSGRVFDWSLVRELKREFFVAGGLNPANVGEVIDQLRPYGVDVCSGVESAPGKKDRRLLKDFVGAAREAEARMFSDVRGR
jgi:phosphoribosylanthranilate isomerase